MSKRREEREQLTTETCSIGDDDARVTKEGVRPCLIIPAFLSVAIVLTACVDHALFNGPMNLPIVSSAGIVILSILSYSAG